MVTLGIVLAVALSLGIGFTLGWASKSHYIKLGEATKRLEEQARFNGRLDRSLDRERPGLNPPSNYFRRGIE
jgi:hypothetical protein